MASDSFVAATPACAPATGVPDVTAVGFLGVDEKKVWYANSTRNDRKSAMRTRRSNSVPSGHRVVTAGAEWVAPREALQGKPAAVRHAVEANGFSCVIRAGGEEPARSGEQRRDQELVTAEQYECHPHAG